MTRKSSILKIQSFALLIIFILMKMGIAHEISHAFSHDEIADCEDCYLILDSNEKNLFDFNTVNYEETTSYAETSHKPIMLLYKNPVITVYHFTKYFNKPPPSLAYIA